MDGTNLILTKPISPPSPLESLENIKSASEEMKQQAAKDFESVLLNKLLAEMKNTIGDWGLETDAASEQIHSIFWTFLGQELANNGGMGLWKDIYQSLNELEQKNQLTVENTQLEPLDDKV
jgi:Rod binding domain-containing protein